MLTNDTTICKNVTNQSFCSNLNSKPESMRDLLSLTQYTFDVLNTNVTNTINLLHGLIAKSASNFNLAYFVMLVATFVLYII